MVGGQRTLSGKTVQVPGGLRPHPPGVVGDTRPSAARSRNMRMSRVQPLLFFGRRTVAAGESLRVSPNTLLDISSSDDRGTQGMVPCAQYNFCPDGPDSSRNGPSRVR